MKIHFLGCGAADYDWQQYGKPGILGATVTLLNDRILLDCGPTAAAAMKRFGVRADGISAIVNTHSHSDHLDIEQVRAITDSRKIDYYGSPESCVLLSDIFYSV